MTALYLRRVGNTLQGDGDESVCALMQLPFNKTFKAEVKHPRNPAFHRLYFALCSRIADGIGSDTEIISTVFKFATGMYETIQTKSYGEIKVPKSISFAKMDNTSFREFFDKCLEVAFSQWGLDATAFSDLLDQKTEKRS